MSAWTYLRGLVGNNWKAVIGIFTFIVLVVLLSIRCSHAAEIDLRAGSSFGPGRAGPVLGLQLYFPVGNDVSLYAGTLLWGKTPVVANTWDWHAGFQTCRWNLCARLGASYVQNVDRVNGSHTNFNLGVGYRFRWYRVSSVDYEHLSDAGTTPVNLGRNAFLGSFRLQ